MFHKLNFKNKCTRHELEKKKPFVNELHTLYPPNLLLQVDYRPNESISCLIINI